MNKKVISYTHLAQKPIVREVAGKGSRTIEGYAIVFNKWSECLTDGFEMYCEMIKPGAVTASDLAKYDITMTMWHDREKLLARSNKGKGTLKLSVDNVGVKFSFEASKGSTGEEALALVRRGDIDAASFTFYEDEAKIEYSRGADGMNQRIISKLGTITEFTLTNSPAYSATSASAREKAKSNLEKVKKYCEEAKLKNLEREIAEGERINDNLRIMICSNFNKMRNNG